MENCYYLPIHYSVKSKKRTDNYVDLILQNCKNQRLEVHVRINLQQPNERRIKPRFQNYGIENIFYIYRGNILTNDIMGDPINLASIKENTKINWNDEERIPQILQMIIEFIEL